MSIIDDLSSRKQMAEKAKAYDAMLEQRRQQEQIAKERIAADWGRQQGLAEYLSNQDNLTSMPIYPIERYDDIDYGGIGDGPTPKQYYSSRVWRNPSENNSMIVPQDVANKYKDGYPIDITHNYSDEEVKNLLDSNGRTFKESALASPREYGEYNPFNVFRLNENK